MMMLIMLIMDDNAENFHYQSKNYNHFLMNHQILLILYILWFPYKVSPYIFVSLAGKKGEGNEVDVIYAPMPIYLAI